MSLFVLRSGRLSLKPRIWVEGDRLQARTSLCVQLLTLFSYARTVTVDRREQLVDIRVRILWFVPRREIIPFQRIDYLRYGFASLGTSWGYSAEGIGRTDQVERYTVGLVLKETGREVVLCSFAGEGAVSTGWMGVIYGDDWVDFEGNQEAASARTVKHLARITGRPVGRPEGQSVERLTGGRTCPHCGRPAPQGRARCLYCGKDLTSGDPRDAWLEP